MHLRGLHRRKMPWCSLTPACGVGLPSWSRCSLATPVGTDSSSGGPQTLCKPRRLCCRLRYTSWTGYPAWQTRTSRPACQGPKTSASACAPRLHSNPERRLKWTTIHEGAIRMSLDQSLTARVVNITKCPGCGYLGPCRAKRHSQLKQARAKFSTWMELGIVCRTTWLELAWIWSSSNFRSARARFSTVWPPRPAPANLICYCQVTARSASILRAGSTWQYHLATRRCNLIL